MLALQLQAPDAADKSRFKAAVLKFGYPIPARAITSDLVNDFGRKRSPSACSQMNDEQFRVIRGLLVTRSSCSASSPAFCSRLRRSTSSFRTIATGGTRWTHS